MAAGTSPPHPEFAQLCNSQRLVCQHVDRQPNPGGDAPDCLRDGKSREKDSIRPRVGVDAGAEQHGVHGGFFGEPEVVHLGIDEHARGALLDGGNLGGSRYRIDQVPVPAVLDVDANHALDRQPGHKFRNLDGVVRVPVFNICRYVDGQVAQLLRKGRGGRLAEPAAVGHPGTCRHAKAGGANSEGAFNLQTRTARVRMGSPVCSLCTDRSSDHTDEAAGQSRQRVVVRLLCHEPDIHCLAHSHHDGD